MVIDTIHMYLELIPMSLGIPYAHVWPILNIDFSGTTRGSVLTGAYDNSPGARARNLEALKQSDNAFFGIVQELAAAYAERVGLKIDWNDPDPTFSKLAVVSQTPKEFDYPEIPWPSHFHYAGPFVDDRARAPIPFPWEKLDGRPLVYASLGTLLNGLDSIYRTILPAVGRMPEIQVVLSKGHNIELADLGPIPSNVIVVDRAPQIELLQRAALCITHAGLNTALESLTHGVPMVAIPLGYDQFGVAARIAHHGAGEFIDVEDLAVDRLHMLIQKVLETPAYRAKAAYFKDVIGKRRGLDVAADVIERAFENAGVKQPVEVSRA
jgi:MGT family glycosyltransferase